MRTNSVTQHIGTPGGSDITFSANPDPGISLQAGQMYNFSSSLNLPSQYSYGWSILQGNSSVGYFYGTGPWLTLSTTSDSGPGGFIVQMAITNSSCNTTGTTSRTFMKNTGGGILSGGGQPKQ